MTVRQRVDNGGRDVTDIGDDPKVQLVALKGELQRFACIVRDGVGVDLCRADVERLGIAAKPHIQVFARMAVFEDAQIRAVRHVNRCAKLTRKPRHAADVVVVFVRDDERVDVLTREIEPFEPLGGLFDAKTAVEQKARCLSCTTRLDHQSIARTAAAQTGVAQCRCRHVTSNCFVGFSRLLPRRHPQGMRRFCHKSRLRFAPH